MATQPVSEVVNAGPAAQSPDSPINQASWSDARAYATGMANFRQMESYKTQNCERRYRKSDEIYLSATNPKTWEGTKVARSAMPYFLALAQIEALLPHVIGSLFNDDLPFGVHPFPGTNMEHARAAMELIRWQLLRLDPKVGPVPFTSLREMFRLGYKSDLIYGNQVIEFGWMNHQQKVTRYDRLLVPVRQTIMHPIQGPVQVPTGQHEWQVATREEVQSISKPFGQHVDLRDFYWDPNCPTPNIQDGRMCARRQFPTVSELMQFTGQPGFNVPDRKMLLDLAKRRTSRPADSSKQQTESMRGNNWNPTLEYNENPDLCRLEVIRYFQKDYVCWFVPNANEGKEDNLVLYNQPNEYQMLPFITSAYTDVLGRWQGLSICDLVEGDQKLAMAILDARIDELNLIIHSPIVRRKGTMVSSTQKRLRPGAEWEVDGKPSEEVMKMEFGNVTQQSFIEVDALDRRSQKTTGVTDTAVVGTSTAGGNSALRSATGASMVGAASSTRIQYQVENKQDQILLPLVYAMHWMNKRFLDPQKSQEILGADWATLLINNSDVMNADVMFEWQAGSRMRTKQSLQSGGLQAILAAISNGPFVSALAQQQICPDYKELSSLICDGLNLPQKSLFRQMTPEEWKQFMDQQQNSEMALRMQMQRERLSAQSQNQESSDDNKLLIELIKRILTPDAAHELLGMPKPAEIAAKAQPKQLTGGK